MGAILDFRPEIIAWYFLPSFVSIGLSVLEKKFKTDFQDGCCGGHLGFSIRTILAIFDLQVTMTVSSQLAFRFRR